jgi:hypothetical protein
MIGHAITCASRKEGPGFERLHGQRSNALHCQTDERLELKEYTPIQQLAAKYSKTSPPGFVFFINLEKNNSFFTKMQTMTAQCRLQITAL